MADFRKLVQSILHFSMRGMRNRRLSAPCAAMTLAAVTDFVKNTFNQTTNCQTRNLPARIPLFNSVDSSFGSGLRVNIKSPEKLGFRCCPLVESGSSVWCRMCRSRRESSRTKQESGGRVRIPPPPLFLLFFVFRLERWSRRGSLRHRRHLMYGMYDSVQRSTASPQVFHTRVCKGRINALF